MKLTEMVALVAFIPIVVIVYYVWFFIFGDFWGWTLIIAIVASIISIFYLRRRHIRKICEKRNITLDQWRQEQQELELQRRLDEYSKLSKGEKISRSLQNYHRKTWE